MMTVEYNQKNESVEIFMDAAGIDHLMTILGRMRGKPDHHAHMMTPSWGGDELDEQLQRPSNTLINHLKIYSVGT